MPATLQPPPAPQPRQRWTVEQFNRMGDMGWFEGRRAFLLDGVILENGPMDTPHAVALGLVQQYLLSAFGNGWFVRGQSPLHVDADNDPFPDFAVVRGSPRDYAAGHPTTADLVVEIADTSLGYDLRDKAERYARANVPDYWVLDLNGRELHVFRNPVPLPVGLGGTAYRNRTVYPPTATISPLATPTATTTVADLLP
jgi:Uma2 family endonuclease